MDGPLRDFAGAFMPKSISERRRVPPYDESSGVLQVVIDTPQGSRYKYKFDEQLGVFKIAAVLPAGMVFPYEFGDVSGTLAEDGDPIDVLVLLEAPTFVGCLVPTRLIGVIEAEQSERDGQTLRNDRLIGMASIDHHQADVQSLDDLPEHLLTEIEHFFVAYNELRGKKFEARARRGPAEAQRLIEEGIRRFAAEHE
jgi:inorganic pyrophosphatase